MNIRLIVMKNRKTKFPQISINDIKKSIENCNNNINNKRTDNLIKNLIIVIIN